MFPGPGDPAGEVLGLEGVALHAPALGFGVAGVEVDAVSAGDQREGRLEVGSEIVGLVPQAALLASASHFLRLEGDPAPQVLENKLLDMAYKTE
jgi:hypothetical protein